MPNRTKPVRAVGVDGLLWEAAKTKAESRGETVTDVINRALREYVAMTSGPAGDRRIDAIVRTLADPNVGRARPGVAWAYDAQVREKATRILNELGDTRPTGTYKPE